MSHIEEAKAAAAQAGGDSELLTEVEVPIRKGRQRSKKRNRFLPNKGSGRRRGTNYADAYPTDELGGEMGENARVWRVYLDEADEYDAEMMESFKDTTDVLLVFAGLFSAVVTTFVAQVSEALQPDYAQVTASLMTELVALQRAMAAGTSVADIPLSQLSFADADATMTSSSHWINGLWFTSLSLSLVSALLSVLVKQWLQHYSSALSGTSRERARIRHFRFKGLKTWKVPQIIETLPVLLHLALFLFMAGLVMFIWALDLALASIVLLITTTCFIFYSISNILASFYPDCSYKTPISQALPYTWCFLCWAFRFGRSSSPLPKTAKQAEREASKNEIDDVLFRALAWLDEASSDPSTRAVVTHSMAGLPFPIDENYALITPFVNNQDFPLGTSGTSGVLEETALLAYCAIHNVPLLLSGHCYQTFTDYPSLTPPAIQCLAALFDLNHRNLSNRSGLSHLDFNKAMLPPWMWKSLFGRNQGWIRVGWSESIKLLMLFLEVMEQAPLENISLDQKDQANWNLPPVVICLSTPSIQVALYLNRPSKAAGWAHTGEPPSTTMRVNKTTSPPRNSGLYSVQLYAIPLYYNPRDDVPAQEYLATVESTLLRIGDDNWETPGLLDAVLHCIAVKKRIQDDESRNDIISSPLPRRRHRPLVNATPMTLALLYLIDILQVEDPWSTDRVAGIAKVCREQFRWLCYKIFLTQEAQAFDTFLGSDGIATLRRCFPYQFDRNHAPDLGHVFIPYIEFVVNLRDLNRRNEHLAFLSRRESLAWLIWLSLKPKRSSVSLSAYQKLRSLLRLLQVERHVWVNAAQVLIEELRKASASFGAQGLVYSAVSDALDAFGLGGDDFRLYGYATEAVRSRNDFQRVLEPGYPSTDPVYGPFAVYYSPLPSPPAVPSELEPKLLAAPGKPWSEKFSDCLGRLKPTFFDLERDGTGIGTTPDDASSGLVAESVDVEPFGWLNIRVPRDV